MLFLLLHVTSFLIKALGSLGCLDLTVNKPSSLLIPVVESRVGVGVYLTRGLGL